MACSCQVRSDLIGVRVEILDDGAFRFVKPDGEVLDSIAMGCTQPMSDWHGLETIHGQTIDAKTAATKWTGESMDYGTAIQWMFGRERRGKGVSAETLGRGVVRMGGKL